MKPSHLQTPRQLSDGYFSSGYSTGPSARSKGYGAVWWTIVTLCAIAGFLLVVTTGPAR